MASFFFGGGGGELPFVSQTVNPLLASMIDGHGAARTEAKVLFLTFSNINTEYNRIPHMTPLDWYVIKTSTHLVLLQQFYSFFLLVTLECSTGCLLDTGMFTCCFA